MNNLRNHVLLIGNLGADPELKELNNDNYVARASLATNESYNKDGEWVTETQWHRLVLWGKNARRFADVARKGTEVAVQGKLKYGSYEDKEGNVRQYAEIVVNEFLVTGNRKPSDKPVAGDAAQAEEAKLS